MDEQRTDDVKRFFSEPGLARFVDAVRARYHSRGVSGIVRVKRLSAKECEMLEGVLGTLQKPGEDLQVPMRRVEDILLKSGFAMTVRELLTCLDGKEALTRAEREQQAESNWNRFVDKALQESASWNLPAAKMGWVEGLREGTTAGSRILRKMHAQNPEEALRQFVHCLDALRCVWEMNQARTTCDEAPSMPMIRLPVLAANITGNAHGFDFKEPAGRLLWHGLREIFGWRDKISDSNEKPEPDEDWEHPGINGDSEIGVAEQARSLYIRETYRFAGIADDDISSQVILFAPHMTGKDEELVLTLRQVERMTAVPTCSGLFVVENPSVFATMLDRMALFEAYLGGASSSCAPILICLNGQPSAATIRLIDRCMEVGAQTNTQLYYSGDFDVKGVSIAQGLARRYGRHFVPWRMGSVDYEKYAHHGIALSVEEKGHLSKMAIDWDNRLGKVMAELGTKVHQELFVEELLHDWMQALGVGV